MTIARRMTATTLVQMRVPDDLLERIDAAADGSSRTAWLLGLATRRLDDTAPGPHAPVTASSPQGQRSIGPGLPSPGGTCMWSACHSRDTDRYAVTDPAELTRGNYREQGRDEDKAGHVLCKRHAAQLEGRAYSKPMRDLPPAWRARGKQPEPAGQPS
jgi:hypothetical protein